MGFCSNFAAKFETFNNSKNTIMTKKIFIIGLVLAAVLSMSGCMPGSEKWNIHIAAHCYIKGGGLQEGEKLVFVNGIQRKCLREWQGQMCKYVAVKYTFRKANGNLDQRILHLLMTEHCDSIIDCSYDGKAEWVNDNDLMMLRDIFPHGVFGGER